MTGRSQRQLKEVTAMLLIGEGVLGVLRPAAHCRIWRTRSRRWNGAIAWFAARPSLVRICGLTELAAGVWLAQQQFAAMPEPTAPAQIQPS